MSEPQREHMYSITVTWTGDRGEGTGSFRGYDRAYDTTASGRPVLQGSSDPAFNGDSSRWNPELLLVASASQCHMLWYLHLASIRQIVVTHYEDTAEAVMIEERSGAGRFAEIVLHPAVIVSKSSMIDEAQALHADASSHCFIANSLNFKVQHVPTARSGDQ